MAPSLFATALVAGMSDALVYADAEGIIRVWNRGAVRVFGFSEAEAVGQRLDIIIPAGLRERHWQGYCETMRTGQTRYGDGQMLSVPAVQRTALGYRWSSPSCRSLMPPDGWTELPRSCAMQPGRSRSCVPCARKSPPCAPPAQTEPARYGRCPQDHEAPFATLPHRQSARV